MHVVALSVLVLSRMFILSGCSMGTVEIPFWLVGVGLLGGRGPKGPLLMGKGGASQLLPPSITSRHQGKGEGWLHPPYLCTTATPVHNVDGAR